MERKVLRMIIVTEQAAFHIQDMIKQSGEDNQYVRLAVQGGGCSGLSYGLGFDNEINETDEQFEFFGVKFIIDKKDMPILKGVSIDYKESMLGGGFTIDNPNAIATCGCGSSFRTAANAGTPEQC